MSILSELGIVAELADAQDLGSCILRDVQVRLLSMLYVFVLGRY